LPIDEPELLFDLDLMPLEAKSLSNFKIRDE
jgi:hypothetical protein